MTAAALARQPTPEDIASSRLIPFAEYLWPSFEVAPHHRLIAQHLEAVDRGEIKRLMIFTPPRHTKSLLSSQLFPSWYLGRHPRHQIITSTYAQELADDFGRQVRNLMRDDLYQKVFPGVGLREDSQAAKRFHTTQGGVYVAVGAGGPITGRGAHLLLIDDPIKNREDAESEAIRRKLKSWYTSTAYTRLMPGGAVVVIQTRWHEDDLAGWLLKEHAQEGWVVLSLPALAEVPEEWALRGGVVWRRGVGDALWPKWYPPERLLEIKTAIGTRDWSALYQQSPVPSEGGMCRLSWFQRYDADPLELQHKARRIVLSLDTAYKPDQMADPSAGLIWGEMDDGDYLLDVWRQRVEYPDLKRAVLSLATKWRPHAVLIEDKASGTSLIQDLRRETRLPVLAVSPGNLSKTVRWAGVTPLIESGRVFLPRIAPWLVDYETEVVHFPHGVHDDQVDATSQYLHYRRGGGSLVKAQQDGREQFRRVTDALKPGW